jgi:benzoyl-CoA reductase/2-hydroxyglutaryl-CoA dehydratase subunit BcrC/BadD/HgdB
MAIHPLPLEGGDFSLNDVKGGMETVLGWVCSYTPEEIFAALGIRSCRLYGGENQASAAQYLPVNLCPLARACLSEGLDSAGTGASLSGVVLTASCHALVHLANAFQHARGGNGQFFVHLLDLPRTFGREDEAACRAFAATLRDLAGRLGEFYGVAWNDEAFLTAIDKQQQVRLLLRELYRMRRERPEQFRAAGLLELVRAAGRTRKEELAPVLSSLVVSLQDAGSGDNWDSAQDGMQDGGSAAAVFLEHLRRQGSPLGPRLLVTGNSLPPAYFDLIEELGGNVVGDDLCQSYRYCLPDTEQALDGSGRDLFMTLARGYLHRPACPRMLAGPERFAYLQALILECRAQGVVYHTLKFCDASIYDYALLRNRFMEAGIPVLYLETEYRDAGLEQARTRIQAFLEVLAPPTENYWPKETR